MRTRIKICGITRPEDLLCAVNAGADAVGFVFHPSSKRFVSAERAAELVDLEDEEVA
jgi:phosphoribosylanthranilate isomerase